METFVLPVRENVLLRFIQPDEAEALYTLVDKNRGYLRTRLPWVEAQTGPETSRQNIEKRMVQAQRGETLDLGIYLSEVLVGSCGFNRIVAVHRKASIGYWLAEPFQGKGIMTDCVHALVSYGFKEMRLHRIRLQCSVGNPKSAAVAERLGFTFEGIAREDEFLYDHFENSRVYSVLEHEWSLNIGC